MLKGLLGNAVATANTGVPLSPRSSSFETSSRANECPCSRGARAMSLPFCSHCPSRTSMAPPFTSITRRPRSGIATTKSPSPSHPVSERTRSECQALQPCGSPVASARWRLCSAWLLVGRGAPWGWRPVGGTGWMIHGRLQRASAPGASLHRRGTRDPGRGRAPAPEERIRGRTRRARRRRELVVCQRRFAESRWDRGYREPCEPRVRHGLSQGAQRGETHRDDAGACNGEAGHGEWRHAGQTRRKVSGLGPRRGLPCPTDSGTVHAANCRLIACSVSARCAPATCDILCLALACCSPRRA